MVIEILGSSGIVEVPNLLCFVPGPAGIVWLCHIDSRKRELGLRGGAAELQTAECHYFPPRTMVSFAKRDVGSACTRDGGCISSCSPHEQQHDTVIRRKSNLRPSQGCTQTFRQLLAPLFLAPFVPFVASRLCTLASRARPRTLATTASHARGIITRRHQLHLCGWS